MSTVVVKRLVLSLTHLLVQSAAVEVALEAVVLRRASSRLMGVMGAFGRVDVDGGALQRAGLLGEPVNRRLHLVMIYHSDLGTGVAGLRRRGIDVVDDGFLLVDLIQCDSTTIGRADWACVGNKTVHHDWIQAHGLRLPAMEMFLKYDFRAIAMSKPAGPTLGSFWSLTETLATDSSIRAYIHSYLTEYCRSML